MKKTYFITMITAALMGSAYANTNYTANPGTHSSPPDNVYGTYADTGEASGASVRVFEVETGGYEYIARVRGGLTYYGNAANNTVTMEGGEVRVMYGGYVAYNGDAAGNTVTVTGGQVPRGICGGHVGGDGDAYENTVTMSDCSAGTSVVGGTANTGKATKNTVSITRSTASGTLYGGYSVSGDATYNAVTMSDGQVGSNVYGGYVDDSGDVTGNTVGMTGVEVYGYVYGGDVYDSGDATGNAVDMTGGKVDGWVYGGSTGFGNATGNTVDMTGGEVSGSVKGGYTYLGDATENAVTINDGQVGDDVYGGYVGDSGDVTGNTVTITGGEVGDDVYGGYTYSGNASGNTVTMSGGEVNDYVYGGYTCSGNATENAVTINDGYVDYNVYGGYTESGDASNNIVVMRGGQVEYLQGGYTDGYGETNNNTVVLNGGIVEENLYAGINYGAGEACSNTAIITGGEVQGWAMGAYRRFEGAARDNSIHLVGRDATAVINGATYTGSAEGIQLGHVCAAYSDGGGELTGNSINIYGSGISTGEMDDMQILAFHLGDGLASASAPMITITNTGLDLEGVELGFYGDAVTDWADFEGKSVTLVSMTSATITGLIIPSDPVDILDAGGEVLATASMVLSDDAQTLSLLFAGGQTSYTANPGSPQTSAPDSIFGKYAETGNVTGGSVGVFEVESGGYSSLGGVAGGYAKSGSVSRCTASLTGGSADAVLGGFSGSGNATNNTVTMTGGSAKTVTGGRARGGFTTGNSVDISGGSAKVVCGGESSGGGATGNTVNISGGSALTVMGGEAQGGDATDNTVNMTDGSVGAVLGGVSVGSDASDNTVNIAGGTVGDVIGGSVAGAGNISRNTVNISGGSASMIFGGQSETPDAHAEGNSVLMTGGEVASIFGAAAGIATGNTVVMTNGKVTGNVEEEIPGDIFGGGAGNGDATDNTVHLVGEGASYTIGKTSYKGGNIAIQGGVHAGYVDGGGVSSNNSVHIHGTGTSIGGTIDSCQLLTFHLVDAQAGGAAAPMVTLGGALNLEGVELGFNGDAVTDWAAFEGKSITLVSMTNETITGLLTPTDSVDITDEDGTVLGTATLTLSDDRTTLTLTDIQGVGPVPTAGPDALDVALVNSLWASSAYVREFVRLSGAQGYALKDGDTAVWGGGFGTFMHTTGDKGFKSDGGGYGIGVNHAFSANTQAGISFGQGFGSYHNSGADGAKVHQRAILAAATASTRITKDLSLGGHLAFGNVRNRADCRLDGESGRARWNDNVFNLGARAAYDFHVTETTAVTPFLGLDWMNGAHESFSGAYGRHYSHGRLNELRMPVGVTVSTSAEVGSTKLLPQLSVAYVPSLAQQLPHADVSGENGDYRVKGYAPGRNAFMLNAGVNAVFSDSWSAGAFYTLETRRHCVDQSVNASVRYTF